MQTPVRNHIRSNVVGYLALFLALSIGTADAAHPGGNGGAEERRGTAPPQLVRADYAETDDGSSPPRSLNAHAKRAAAVKFKTRFRGKSAKGKARYDESTSDTDLHGEARHPWKLVRKEGGRKVLRLIHESLAERGKAPVKVIMAGATDREVARVTFKLADCHHDPPFYPLSCEAKP